jgi:hypothetical protein
LFAEEEKGEEVRIKLSKSSRRLKEDVREQKKRGE